jgi:DNA-binding NarL/FixJ family response regulator
MYQSSPIEGEEMSVVAIRPWTSHEDIILQRLAAAGKYVAAIAAETNRSEAAIRTHAALLNLTLAKGQRGPKAKAKAK